MTTLRERKIELSKLKPQKRPLRAAIKAAQNWVKTSGMVYDAHTEKYNLYVKLRCYDNWGRMEKAGKLMGPDSWREDPDNKYRVFTKKECTEFGWPAIAYASLATDKHLVALGVGTLNYVSPVVHYLNILAFGPHYDTAGDGQYTQAIDDGDLSFIEEWEKHLK